MTLLAAFNSNAGPLTISISTPTPPQSEGYQMGQSRRPDGATLSLDENSLRLDGKAWTPVMGEFHYSRYPETEWREELLKMKAGGIDIVATYVFWIHHEEIQGQFDWTGRRNLRRFIETARDAGLKVIVRCGPWCHGEVRNGGLPDWTLKTGWKTRSDDTNYLAKTAILYQQIAGQLKGLLWKDGGPVIGIQLENEYSGPAEHLLTLKRLAQAAGLDVPIYTRTGWPELRTPMPFGEIIPLYGVYAEGFWDRELTPMPGRYWSGFHFSFLRTDSNIANELLGRRDAKDSADVARYPYLTCEIGGGMMNSYHRRIRVHPADIDATTLVKLGSGSTSPGYYMYHGGVNPEGKLSTLMESQATGYWNDLPVKGYDFQAPLGEFGQVRPQYHSLRRLHLFLHEWGSLLAGMPAAMPDQRPTGRDDVSTLRWSVRSDGKSGFVFVNNYQRLQELPAKTDVQFQINLPSGPLTFPAVPVTVPSGARFFWPFNFDLGKGIKLQWATAQPMTALDVGNDRTVFFSEVKGLPAQFSFARSSGEKISLDGFRAFAARSDGGGARAWEFPTDNGGMLRIVLLNEAEALALSKATWLERERVFLTAASLVVDGNELRLTSPNPADMTVCIYPAPARVNINGKEVSGRAESVFQRFTPRAPRPAKFKASFKSIQPAGPPREIPIGKIAKPVAAAPEDADFAKAAVWKIKLPSNLDLNTDPLLRLNFAGDVIRVTLNGKLITDDFYNGNALEVGLRRHAPEILTGDLRVAILPLRKDAPIYMAKEARPDFGNASSVAELKSVEIVPRYHIDLTADGRSINSSR
jgi:beta-galactosidase